MAVSTRFLRREMQKQQARNKNGLSIINFSSKLSFAFVSLVVDNDVDVGVSGNGGGLIGDEIDFALLLKHDDGKMYILLNLFTLFFR
jgi:hypothetical protein